MRAKAFHDRVKIRTGNFRDVRSEMSRLYASWVRKEIDGDALRSGSLALYRMANLDQGIGIDERLAEVERRLDGTTPPGKSNGHVPGHWSTDA